MNKHKNQEYVLFAIFLFLSIFAHLYLDNVNKDLLTFAKETNIKVALANSLHELQLEAQAVAIYDFTLDEDIYFRNANTPMPIASLVKVLTSIISLQDKEYEQVVITEDSLSQIGDQGLVPNELWDKKELIKFMLFTSSNDGAHALSTYDKNFITEINNKARKIGMEKALISSVTGLDFNTGNACCYATARDINILSGYALKANREIFTETNQKEKIFRSLSGMEYRAENTNQVIDKIPNLIFSKTGFTYSAGGNLAIIFIDRRGHEIGVSILGSSFEGRFSDIEKIVNVFYNEQHENQ